MAHTRGYKAVVVTDLVFQVLFWGVPGLIASTRLASLWEVELPSHLVYTRLLGAFSLGWGYLLLRALRRPAANADILRGAVVSHTLIAVVVLYSLFSKGVTGYLSVPFWSTIFWWVTIFLNAAFAVGILVSAPRAAASSRTAPDVGGSATVRIR